MVEIQEDILKSLVRHLRSDDNIKALHSLIPSYGVNPVLGPPLFLPDENRVLQPHTSIYPLWIFYNFDTMGQPSAVVDGSGSCAVVLTHAMSWASRSRGTGGISYPEIQVHYFCDPTRKMDIGGPVVADARDKCLTIHKAVTKVFHVINNSSDSGYMEWGKKEDGTGALRVISSTTGRDLSFMPMIRENDTLIEARASFNMEVKL